MNKDFLNHEISYRNEKAIDTRSNIKILILGAGALGSWITDFLSRQGYNYITILDMDRVENKNLGTQNYSKKDVSRMKSSCLKNKILLNFESLKIESIEKQLTSDNAEKIIKNYDLIIDVFDNIESRRIVKETSAKLNKDCVHVGMSDDGFSEIEWNDRYIIPDQKVNMKDICDYPLASNLVFITASLACEVINSFVDNKRKRTIHFTIGDLNTHKVR